MFCTTCLSLSNDLYTVVSLALSRDLSRVPSRERVALATRHSIGSRNNGDVDSTPSWSIFSVFRLFLTFLPRSCFTPLTNLDPKFHKVSWTNETKGCYEYVGGIRTPLSQFQICRPVTTLVLTLHFVAVALIVIVVSDLWSVCRCVYPHQNTNTLTLHFADVHLNKSVLISCLM